MYVLFSSDAQMEYFDKSDICMYVTGVSAAAVAHLRENNNDKCSDSKKKFTFYGGNSKPIKIGVGLGNQLIIVVNWLVSSSSPS